MRTTRRDALTGVTASLTASAAVRTVSDANLIWLCDRLIALNSQADILYDQRVTLEAEQRTQPAVDLHEARIAWLQEMIEDELPPRTASGALAVARAVMATAVKTPTGDLVHDYNPPERMALQLAKFLADGARD